MNYTTSTGVELRLERIPRQRIDQFACGHPVPEPPMRKADVWGGVTEDVPDYNDPGYQADLMRYYLELGKLNVELIADAVTLVGDDVDLSELYELRDVGLGSGSMSDFLRYTVSDEDVQNIVAEVLYQSTVTDRGLKEASTRYNVRWGGRQINAFIVLGKSKGSYGAEFEARRAAQFNFTKWKIFCEMYGAEQSDIVAFFRLSNSLAWLQSKERG